MLSEVRDSSEVMASMSPLGDGLLTITKLTLTKLGADESAS
jgi:hypothetical protein